LQVDRINNNGNYCPSNCRFIKAKENIRNKNNLRINKKTANKIKQHYISTDDGYKKTASKFNVSWYTVRNIIRRGEWAQ